MASMYDMELHWIEPPPEISFSHTGAVLQWPGDSDWLGVRMRAFLSNSPRCVIVFKYATRSMLFQVALQSPSGQAGLLPKDLLVAVQGQTVLDRSHEEVVKMIKDSGKELRLTVERGDGLVPNMELLAKPEDRIMKEKETNVYLKAATEEIEVPNHYRKKEKVFTTAGPPKIETDQYNQPMGLYSAETVARMADTVEIDAKLNGTGENQVCLFYLFIF